MRTRFRDGGLYYMGGKYGMGGMYPSYEHGGEHDPPKVKTVGNNIDFNSGDDTVKSTRTYTEGPTTTTTTDYMSPEAAYMTMQGQINERGGNATDALINYLANTQIESRLVDEFGEEIKDQGDYDRFMRRQQEALKKGLFSGEIDSKTYETEMKLLQGRADDFPEYVQAQGRGTERQNIYGRIAELKDPMGRVNKRLQEESHWFDPNAEEFGPGGFDVHRPDHVIRYQMMYNHLAAPGEEIVVDGKWGEQTDSATIPIEKSTRKELDGRIDPELQMRLTTVKPSGGWDQEQEGGDGGDYRTRRRRIRIRRGGGGGGGDGCVPGRPCAAYNEDGGLPKLRARFKDGGVYVMR